MRKLRIGFFVLLLAVAGLAGYSVFYYEETGPLQQPTNVLFKHGQGFQAIVDGLGEQGIITQPLLFKVLAVGLGQARKFKAGEYNFTPGMSAHEVMAMIAEGKVVVHKVTIPEGLTVREVVKILKDEPILEGDVPAAISEGSLLPETYHFTYGDTRKDIITRMQAGMHSLLAEAWQHRKADLPVQTPEQALVLASIVEKETGVDGERPRVASVFVNRLKRGMKLQSDPTVAYGIEQKMGAPMGRSLTLDDLHAATPYNTYVIDALPPTPIANPGRAAVEAALNPASTDDLYFVATGSGGHNFAATLAEHNRNVAAYRQAVKGK